MPGSILSVRQVASDVHAFDHVELRIELSKPGSCVTGRFRSPDGRSWSCYGFNVGDDPKGSCLRFMPPVAGRFQVEVQALWPNQEVSTAPFEFEVSPGANPGMLEIDPEFPEHFRWSGSENHVFLNGTTAYFLLGFTNTNDIEAVVRNLAANGINRIRVALMANITGGEVYSEPHIQTSDRFTMTLNPWGTSASEPTPDWELLRRCDRMLEVAREVQIVVSLIFYLDGYRDGVQPFGRFPPVTPAELEYFALVVDRFSCFSNVTWDLANEYRNFRTREWAEALGQFVKGRDPYPHLVGIHGFPYFFHRASSWADFASYQSWDEAGGHDYMELNLEVQRLSGVPKPQINEEYGYEDHYPSFAQTVPVDGRNADSRRRIAWGIAMAGCYQTAGMTTRLVQAGQQSHLQGGWLNGAGESDLFRGLQFLRTRFEALEWWKMTSDLTIVNHGVYCLAEPGRQYLAYVLWGKLTIRVPKAAWKIEVWNPSTGALVHQETLTTEQWDRNFTPYNQDWVVSLVAVDSVV